ncbi:hypothetical protein ACPUEX_22405 [Enterobacter vonholyi]
MFDSINGFFNVVPMPLIIIAVFWSFFGRMILSAALEKGNATSGAVKSSGLFVAYTITNFYCFMTKIPAMAFVVLFGAAFILSK